MLGGCIHHVDDRGLPARAAVQLSGRPRQGIVFRRADSLLMRKQAIISDIELYRSLENRGKFRLCETKLPQGYSLPADSTGPDTRPHTGGPCE